MEYRICIAGSRTFNDYELAEEILTDFVNAYLKPDTKVIIVSGNAKGADRIGEQLAENYGLDIEDYPARWDLHGRSAGYKRNVEMAEVSDAIIIFWNGISKGSKHMIDICQNKGKLLWVNKPTTTEFNGK